MKTLTMVLFSVALASALPAQIDAAADAVRARTLTNLCIPMHTAPDDLGTPYGLWAAGDTYKASFHDGMTFVPYLGSDYPHNQPWSWRTTAITAGTVDLLGSGHVVARHSEWRYEYDLGAVTEAYDVRAEGLEQTFVVAHRPAAGDLVVTGEVSTMLSAPDRDAEHGALMFVDADGRAIVGYGAAFAFDAVGSRIAIPTGHRDGQITLTVPAAWLETAVFPVTIDPLLTRVTISTAPVGYSVRDVDVARCDFDNRLLVTYVRAASQFDDDVAARVGTDAFGSLATIYSDITSNWDSDGARCAQVSGTYERWAIVFRRYFANNPIRLSQIRCHVHTCSDTTLGTNVGSLAPPSGHNDWRPSVGGVIHPMFGPEMNALVVFQAEDNSNTAGHWANQTTSYVAGSLLDTSTTNGTFGARFTIQSTSLADCERPAVNKVAVGNVFSWVCAFQYYSNNILGGDDWDIVVKIVTHTGLVALASWQPDANANDAWHKFGPIVEGTSGRYAIVFTATDTATLPGSTGTTTGKQVWIERFDWPYGATSPSGDRPPVLLAGAADRRFVARGLGYALDWASHWAASWSEIASGVHDLHYARVGYTGNPTETGTLHASSSATPYGGGCVYDDDNRAFQFGYGFHETVVGHSLTYVTPTPWSTSGVSCSGATISWQGTQQIGAQFSRIAILQAPPLSGHLLFVSLGTADLPLVHPVIQPGCRLLVDAGPALLGTMAFQIGAAVVWELPLPESLPPMTVHFQDFVLDGGLFETTQRLTVPVVK